MLLHGAQFPPVVVFGEGGNSFYLATDPVEPEVDYWDAIPGWPECLPIQWMSRHDQAADVAAGPALDPRATMAIEWSAPVLRSFDRVFRDRPLEMVRHRLGHGGA